MTNHRVHVFEDVAMHDKKGDCWLIISGKVYDVSSFLDDHPGGDEVLLTATGKDATADFEDVGHSDEAKDLLNKYYIGEVDSLTLPVKHQYEPTAAGSSAGNQTSGGLVKLLQFLIPLLILGVALALRQYKKKE
ncbi:hypothetical protein ACH5RR_000035 [Cinchona calisaya]|uniref:Cytochrome b5 heme-binding domain-containing protein n=1 Tax=Cinchona calisaya TaxID=153742 RepID=A0ABD3AZJ9_9GENT